jgi:hypothetical protein
MLGKTAFREGGVIPHIEPEIENKVKSGKKRGRKQASAAANKDVGVSASSEGEAAESSDLE